MALSDANASLVEMMSLVLGCHCNREFDTWMDEQVKILSNGKASWVLPPTPSWHICKLRGVEKKVDVRDACKKRSINHPTNINQILVFYDTNTALSKEMASFQSGDDGLDSTSVRSTSTSLCSKFTVWQDEFKTFMKERAPGHHDRMKPFHEEVALQVDRIFSASWKKIMQTPIVLLEKLMKDRTMNGIKGELSDEIQKKIKSAMETCGDAAFLVTGLNQAKKNEASVQNTLGRITEYCKGQFHVWLEAQVRKSKGDFAECGKFLRACWELFVAVLEMPEDSKVTMDVKFEYDTWRFGGSVDVWRVWAKKLSWCLDFGKLMFCGWKLSSVF